MYKYYNQLHYPYVLYPILTDMPEFHQDKVTVKQAGCGLCAASMLVENYEEGNFKKYLVFAKDKANRNRYWLFR